MALSPADEVQIEDIRQRRSKTLVLSDRDLKRIPDEIYELAHLEELDLWGNHIGVVPERIRELPNLKRLDLTGIPIRKVPDIPGLVLDWSAYLRCRESLSRENVMGIDVNTEELPEPTRLLPEIVSLPNFRHLEVGLAEIRSDTPIPEPTPKARALIDSIGQLHNLEGLVLFGMLLREVPAGVRNLKGLHWLNLSAIGLRELPDWVADLRDLTELRLFLNELETLPDSLASLARLEYVDLHLNRFTEIPEVLFRIRMLADLNLRYDRGWGYEGHIKQIPSTILQLENLRTLNVDGQPIETPPPEVVGQGVDAIKNYWRQQQEAGVDYLCEAKLLILGEAGAGKTSLAQKIKDRNYELKPGESSTEGIEVLHWSFPAAVRVKHDAAEELLLRDLRVNIWDFGGQEVYHATHQFFLTRRSLYALVADDRKEDTDFNYWLQAVELLSDRSPLLIVQNERQDRQRDINLGSLRARFPNLKEAYRTNLATNRGLDDLVAAIRQELERLPHIGTPLPRTWKRVRESLEKDPRNHIGIDEYLAICQEHGFKRREDKLQLSGYLHDLGICLHFQDDPVLSKTVILKPKWGADAVYRVLDDHTVINNRGRFGPADLARIWSEDMYAPMRHELLRLMMRFQFCYRVPDEKSYIAPQLLSSTQPAYEWDERGNLVLRYEYDFMPKGLITRLIVALHHRIADQALVWKSGVILERDDARAEVIEDYPRRKITVRVAGPDTSGLLAIVDDHLDLIHRSFPRLKYEKYLPCSCGVCRQRPEPFAYKLSALQNFVRIGKGIQCYESGELVDAATLIRDIFPAALRATRPDERAAPEPATKGEVFVSYAWTEPSKAIVDQIEKLCKDRSITLHRDKSKMRYRDSIREFMQRIGRGKCIVVVVSKDYLESADCMFELTEIDARGNIRDRVFPVVLEDANIYSAMGRLGYIKYWEQKKAELDSELKKVGGEHLEGSQKELNLYAKIRETIDRIVDILSDMNALTPEQHQGSNFQALLSALEARLSE
ncbi:MAG: COR domain-containing protein [Bryobacteraceae bacterium]|jgi:Leucine-rich repeat (LRR) protein